MKKIFAFGAALLALVSAAHAATPTPMPISYRTTHYRCDGGQNVSVKAVRVDKADFVVVTYGGRQYALAPAVSASGARYAALSGMTTGTGLEWVQWQGKGFLNSFPVDSPDDTKKVLENCKAVR